ncbi:MAG TPA: D-Ala-D-Ala carboxypeptidase family metallohydrolase [Bryobacteraceae bacterium]|nr:D-Ala-D-Ala carboxypeptidase family metallohydrolase [Bryobacteraceae bacterium]
MRVGATGPHFSEAELACHHCGVNQCKQALVDALEAFRTIVGKPVVVDSAYRCPQHNADSGGAVKSEHVEGLAADIRVNGISATELEAAARKIHAIRGIGRNDHQQYIHVDVRPTLTLARWCYSPDGQWCSYYPPLAEAA